MSNRIPSQQEKAKEKLTIEFLENRTSWRFFNKALKSNVYDFNLYQGELLLEILKELQFMNNTKS